MNTLFPIILLISSCISVEVHIPYDGRKMDVGIRMDNCRISLEDERFSCKTIIFESLPGKLIKRVFYKGKEIYRDSYRQDPSLKRYVTHMEFEGKEIIAVTSGVREYGLEAAFVFMDSCLYNLMGISHATRMVLRKCDKEYGDQVKRVLNAKVPRISMQRSILRSEQDERIKIVKSESLSEEHDEFVNNLVEDVLSRVVVVHDFSAPPLYRSSLHHEKLHLDTSMYQEQGKSQTQAEGQPQPQPPAEPKEPQHFHKKRILEYQQEQQKVQEEQEPETPTYQYQEEPQQPQQQQQQQQVFLQYEYEPQGTQETQEQLPQYPYQPQEEDQRMPYRKKRILEYHYQQEQEQEQEQHEHQQDQEQQEHEQLLLYEYQPQDEQQHPTQEYQQYQPDQHQLLQYQYDYPEDQQQPSQYYYQDPQEQPVLQYYYQGDLPQYQEQQQQHQQQQHQYEQYQPEQQQYQQYPHEEHQEQHYQPHPSQREQYQPRDEQEQMLLQLELQRRQQQEQHSEHSSSFTDSDSAS